MNTKQAFSTLFTVLITAVVVGVLTSVISYSSAASKKDFEIEDLKDQLSKAREETAATDEISNWQTYADDKYGFSFKYPDNIQLNPDRTSRPKDYELRISTEIINEITTPIGGWDKETAIKDKDSLLKGDPSVKIGWGIDNKLLKLEKGLVGKEFVVLAQYSIDSIEFTRIALFYKGDIRIILGLSQNDIDKIIRNNPKYFQKDDNLLRWKDDGIDQFSEDLVIGKTDAVAQDWYKLFDQILSTFQFTK